MEKTHDLFSISKQSLVQKRQKFEVHYNILEEIGKGAFGTVVKARHRVTNATVAIKIIDKMKNYRHLSAIERELKILRALDHPNIIKLYEWFDDMKKLYLVFEYCGGGELYDTLYKFGGMEEKRAAAVFYQVLLALNYMHKQKICHRDIKADNCLFLLSGPDSPLKLIDFGLALEYADPSFIFKRKSQNRVWTDTTFPSAWNAPEVLRRNYGEKCDLWSAGVLLYFIVTGTMPFSAPNDPLLYEQIKKGGFEFPDNKKLSPECMSLISNLLKTKPEERFSATQALDHPWFSTALAPKPAMNFSFGSLTNYLKLDKMQKLVIAYIAAHTSDSELVKHMNGFIGINTSKSGVLSREEVEKWAAEKSGDKGISMEDTFNGIDINQTKGVEYLDFVAAFLPEHIRSNEGFLTDAFEFFDKVFPHSNKGQDENGQICANDIKKMMSEAFDIPEKSVSALYRKYDKDKNNALGFSEFSEMMKVPLTSPMVE